MSSSQSGPGVACHSVRNKTRILYSDWVLDHQDSDKGDSEGNKINKVSMEDTEAKDNAEKPKKRGRPRKSNKVVESVKKAKKSAGMKTKKMVPSDLAMVKSSKGSDAREKVNKINLDEWITDEGDVEQQVDITENQKLAPPVVSLEKAKSSSKVFNIKEKYDMKTMTDISTVSQDEPSPVSGQAPGHHLPKVSPALLSTPTPPGQPRLLKALVTGVERSRQGVKSEHKIDEDNTEVSAETVSSAKIRNPPYDLTYTSTEEDTSPAVPDQGLHQAPAKQLSVPRLVSSPGQAQVRPPQPRMPRPPRPGMGRGRARPTGPRPVRARGGMVSPGPRLYNPRSLAPMRRSSSHPQPQYFPGICHPAYSPRLEQFHSPSPCSSPILSTQDVSIVREVAPPARQGWVPPPGLTMVRVPATGPTVTISTLATVIHQLGQVEGRVRSIQYRLTDEQISALHTLGVVTKEVGDW